MNVAGTCGGSRGAESAGAIKPHCVHVRNRLCYRMVKTSWKPPNIDWAEALVFGFIVVTGAIMVGSLVKRYVLS